MENSPKDRYHGSMKMGDSMRTCWVILFLIFQTAEANTGFPTIVMFEPLLILTLIPVIFIEYEVMRRHLKNVENSLLLKSVSISNLCSTFIGFPITWVMMLVLQDMFEKIMPLCEAPFEPAWLLPLTSPWDGKGYTVTMKVMIVFSLLFMLGAHFLMSWWSEFFINSRIIPKTECRSADIKLATRTANLASYAFLVLVTALVWCYEFCAQATVCGGFQPIAHWAWLFAFKIANCITRIKNFF